MSKKRKVIVGLAVLAGLFCMVIGVTAVAKENELQIIGTEVIDDVTSYYVKENGEYYMYTIIDHEKTEEKIQEYKEMYTDPVKIEYTEEEWVKWTAARRSKDSEMFMIEDMDSYCACFVMKLERDSIKKEVLEEWEK